MIFILSLMFALAPDLGKTYVLLSLRSCRKIIHNKPHSFF